MDIFRAGVIPHYISYQNTGSNHLLLGHLLPWCYMPVINALQCNCEVYDHVYISQCGLSHIARHAWRSMAQFFEDSWIVFPH